MPETKTYRPGPKPGTVLTADGKVLAVPAGWILLEPGDAALTRRTKAAGPHFAMEIVKGRKRFSQGIYAPSETIGRIRLDLEQERSTEAYSKKMESAAKRREKVQSNYVVEFESSVLEYLAFHPTHQILAKKLATLVTAHATPVGSGTVARTQRIPVEQRAEAAVIAWMRHQTTAYDSMVIPRVKGKRREVRRMLAQRSKQILDSYRKGESPLPNCPLKMALTKKDPSA